MIFLFARKLKIAVVWEINEMNGSITLRSSTIIFQVEILRCGKKINCEDSMFKVRLNSWLLFGCTKRRKNKSLNCFITDRSVNISSFIKIKSHKHQMAKESSSLKNFSFYYSRCACARVSKYIPNYSNVSFYAS